MSIRVMSWAWEQQTQSSGERLTLLALADHADDDGECWPSSGRIAEKASLTRSTVLRHIESLVERGLLSKVERRRRQDGTLGTWLIRLNHDAPVRDPDSTDATTTTHPRVVVQTAPVLAQEPSSSEPSLNPLPSVASIDAEFAAFWSNYPRKVGKPAALKAYRKALGATTALVILDGLARWCGYWSTRNEPEYVPHPSTWLHQERWNDEPPAAPTQRRLSAGADALLRMREERLYREGEQATEQTYDVPIREADNES